MREPSQLPGARIAPRRRKVVVPIAPELAALLAALALLTFAAACRHTSAPPAAAIEITEPMDQRDAAWCGALRPGTHAILRGHVAAAGGETCDRFAFVATSACALRCRARPNLPGAELVLRAIDVTTGQRIDVSAETGIVRIDRAGRAIDLVVSASWGSSSYTLDVEALALGSEEPASAPRVPLARAPLQDRGFRVQDRGFHVETALVPAAAALR